MNLTEPLKELVASVPGAMGAILVDRSGEAITFFSVQPQIDERTSPEERIRLIGAHQNIWLNHCCKIIEDSKLDHLNHLVHTYEGGRVMGRPLKDEYAIFLVGNIGMPLSLGLRFLDEASAIIESDL